MGENKYENVRTGVSGEIPEETARESLRFNLEATTILNEYPEIQNLIKRLNLKFEK